MRRLRLTLALAICVLVGLGPPLASAALAEGGGDGGTNQLSCSTTQQWTGTQTSAEVLEVSGHVTDVPCPQPQVNTSAGDTTYTTSFTPPPNGTACKETLWSDVWMGDLKGGTWQVRYYDPNADNEAGGVVGATIPDNPDYFPVGSITWSLGDLAEHMGSYTEQIPWAMEGTYQGGSCVPNSAGWIVEADTCDPWNADFEVQTCFVMPQPRGTLTYTPPSTSTFTPYLADVIANMKATYQTGTVTTSWANGGQAVVSAGVGQAIVRYPVCFADTGGNLGTPHYWEILIPQANAGPALVVDYVVSASVDETWWDFGDGTSEEVPSTASQAACSVEHTYYHVSADVYGSDEDHTSPPGETWSFGSEPQPDMEVVEAWYHVAVTVTAHYREPDGSTAEQSLPVPPGTDFWLADTPEWQTVGQLESIPCQCTASPSAGA